MNAFRILADIATGLAVVATAAIVGAGLGLAVLLIAYLGVHLLVLVPAAVMPGVDPWRLAVAVFAAGGAFFGVAALAAAWKAEGMLSRRGPF
jgi:hypothetical protein